MPILTRSWMLALSAGALFCSNLVLAVPVIPGAAGFGMDTPAGRGGKVIRVTTLNDSGPGSLRDCVTAAGPRVCVFDISGTIKLGSNLVVSNPNITIAGQTAPAPGIMLRGAALAVSASDVLVQHLAVRAGDDMEGPKPSTRDSLKVNNGARNVVIDHCSLSWALDENMETYKDWGNLTVSNTILSEGLHAPLPDPTLHSYGALIHTTTASSSISFVGNLFAHNRARTPRSNAARFVFVNNVVYNPGANALMLFNSDGISSVNSVVGNVFIKGNDTESHTMPIKLNGPEAGGGLDFLPQSTLYIADNISWLGSVDPLSFVANNSSVDLEKSLLSSSSGWPAGLKAISTSGGAVLNRVLDNVGSRPAQRDAVDARIVTEVKNGTGQVIYCVSNDGSAKCSKNGGGWPSYEKKTRVLDLPQDPNGDSDNDGYTNLEEWLHEMAARVEGASESQPQPGEPPAPLPPTLQE